MKSDESRHPRDILPARRAGRVRLFDYFGATRRRLEENSAHRRGRATMALVSILGLIGALVPALALTASPAGATSDPSGVSFTLAGCNPSVPTTLPVNGKFICPTDGDYTTGNLGKSWNELDIVPIRIETKAGQSAPLSQTYAFAEQVDHTQVNSSGVTEPGYDVLSSDDTPKQGGTGNGEPVLNTALSSAACQAMTATDSAVTATSATATSLSRVLTVTQAQNTDCFYDAYARLALGSHLFPGSSLHYNLANQNLTTAGIGSKDVSIPVNEISPQSLDKDMTAVQGSSQTWDVTKNPSPANLTFTNTCSATASDLHASASVTVTWSKKSVDPSGPVTITTHVYATNPAARIITTTVSDSIYTGGTQNSTTKVWSGGTLASTSAPVTKDVPANTAGFLMMTDTVEVPAGSTGLYDTATGTYTDQATGIPIPGSTSAQASATAQVSQTPTLNTSVVISDVQHISGAGYSYSVDSVSVNGGTPDTTGISSTTETTADVTWTSASQTTNGSATINMTVYVAAGTINSGTLTDTATLTGSDGFTTSDTGTIDLGSSANVTVGIKKTMQGGLVDGNTQKFFFDVYPGNNPGTGAPSGVAKLNASPIEIDITPPATSNTATFTTPATGTTNTFTVVEETPPSGWTAGANAVVTITLPNCDTGKNPATISNTFGPATAQVNKSTVPAGSEAGWVFNVVGPGTFTATGTTVAGGAVNGSGTTATSLALPSSGDYTITETPQTGWFESDVKLGTTDQGVGSCTFTVSYPNDADKGFTCAFVNTQFATAKVVKTTNPSGGQAGWHFTITGPGGFTDTGATDTNGNLAFSSDYLAPGSYTVTETSQSGWVEDSVSLDGAGQTGPTCTFTVAYPGSAGHTFTCSFINDELAHAAVHKTTNPTGNQAGWSFTLSGPGVSEQKTTDTNGNISFTSVLGAGTYTISETSKAGWFESGVNVDGGTSQGTGSCSFTVTLPTNANHIFTCNFANTEYATAKVVKTVGNPPAAPTGTQAFLFQLRSGASLYATGTTLESGTANAADGGVINFATSLTPGTTYQICEQVMPAWLTSLSPSYTPSLYLPGTTTLNPGVDNSWLCEDFTPTAGQTATFSVNNTPPPGGRALTIGFWKNWASCTSSSTSKKPVLDQALAAAMTQNSGLGVVMSAQNLGNGWPAFAPAYYLQVKGSTATPNAAPDCLNAVNLLSKQNFKGAKEASDPAFNLAAQLLAAQLNYYAGAGQLPAVTTDINQAVVLLGKYSFNGTGYTGKISSSDANAMNLLANKLDNYNNNVCGC